MHNILVLERNYPHNKYSHFPKTLINNIDRNNLDNKLCYK